MSQMLVRNDAGSVADWIRSSLHGAGFSISSDQADSVQIDPAGQLGERHNIIFERRPSAGADSELIQVWVVEAGLAECAVTVLPEGELARTLLAGVPAAGAGGD